jgi:hypothetical protein
MKRIIMIICMLSVLLLFTACSRTSIVIPRGYEGIFQVASNLNWAFVVAIFLAEVTLGWVCLYVAWRKGYSPVGFFFFGFFLFIPAIIVIACIKPRAGLKADSNSQTYQPVQTVVSESREMLQKDQIPPVPAIESMLDPDLKPSDSLEDKLAKISRLKEYGKITEDEYQLMRDKIIGPQVRVSQPPAPKHDRESVKLPQPSNPTEEEILKILNLKERGIITEQEYQEMRKKVLGL